MIRARLRLCPKKRGRRPNQLRIRISLRNRARAFNSRTLRILVFFENSIFKPLRTPDFFKRYVLNAFRAEHPLQQLAEEGQPPRVISRDPAQDHHELFPGDGHVVPHADRLRHHRRLIVGNGYIIGSGRNRHGCPIVEVEPSDNNVFENASSHASISTSQKEMGLHEPRAKAAEAASAATDARLRLAKARSSYASSIVTSNVTSGCPSKAPEHFDIGDDSVPPADATIQHGKMILPTTGPATRIAQIRRADFGPSDREFPAFARR